MSKISELVENRITTDQATPISIAKDMRFEIGLDKLKCKVIL